MWLLLNALELLRKENDKLGSLSFQAHIYDQDPENFYDNPNKNF